MAKQGKLLIANTTAALDAPLDETNSLTQPSSLYHSSGLSFTFLATNWQSRQWQRTCHVHMPAVVSLSKTSYNFFLDWADQLHLHLDKGAAFHHVCLLSSVCFFIKCVYLSSVCVFLSSASVYQVCVFLSSVPVYQVCVFYQVCLFIKCAFFYQVCLLIKCVFFLSSVSVYQVCVFLSSVSVYQVCFFIKCVCLSTVSAYHVCLLIKCVFLSSVSSYQVCLLIHEAFPHGRTVLMKC